MFDDAKYNKAIGDLRAILLQFKPGQKIYDEIVATRDEVFARYRPVFSSQHVQDLTQDEFTSFLYIENNHHWSGLYRKGLAAASDLQTLRQALGILLDETRSIRDRFPEAIDKVVGLGKGIATGILTVAYPDKYGVWNNTSEAVLLQMGVWPKFEKGEGLGGRYQKINDLLVRLSRDLGIDLWTLDALWWVVLDPEQAPPPSPETTDDTVQVSERFALERQLETFLLENWERTPLGKEWAIYSTPGDLEAGNQFPTDVGRIDILATNKNKSGYLIIELKRNQSTDQTVGQALRYVGWVTKHLARKGESVEALIIAHSADKETLYALSTLPNVRMMTYEVEFRLKSLDPL